MIQTTTAVNPLIGRLTPVTLLIVPNVPISQSLPHAEIAFRPRIRFRAAATIRTAA